AEQSLTGLSLPGLCLCYGGEEENEELPRPSISAWPSSVVKCKSNVTLRCWTHFQNVTVTLGKLHNSGYQQELRSAGKEAEFHLTNLQPEDAGGYFCAYRTATSHRWSRQSQHLQLVHFQLQDHVCLHTATLPFMMTWTEPLKL
uniref:Immunoglobulin domain-containing protein n=1 Tax=Peromyscus maniculatus bairdii TaxID=230844 RepID=A0A8C8UB33_PERMB